MSGWILAPLATGSLVVVSGCDLSSPTSDCRSRFCTCRPNSRAQNLFADVIPGLRSRRLRIRSSRIAHAMTRSVSMSLAVAFKPRLKICNGNSSRQRRLKFQPSPRDGDLLGRPSPALKGRAKITVASRRVTTRSLSLTVLTSLIT